MKIALLHRESAFANELRDKLRSRLSDHELLTWTPGEAPPADDIDIVAGAGTIGSKAFDVLPRVSLVQTTSAGYEGVDIDAASERGIWVSYAPSEKTGNAVSVAECAVLLVLAAARHLNTALASLHDRSVAAAAPGLALEGKTACIVGLGGIGHLLIDRLRPFGMKLLATDEHPDAAPADVEAFEAGRLKEAISQADVVVLCLRASKENENLFDEAMFGAMKRGSVLVNVARGSLVDEAALARAVASGHLAAAGLDVLRNEPADPNDPLFAQANVFVTPHIAGATDLMVDGTVRYVGEAIEAFAKGVKPASLLNEPAKPRRPLAEP